MRIFVLTPWFPTNDQDQSGNFILDSMRALSQHGIDVNILVAQPWVPSFAGLLHSDWGREKLNKSVYESEFTFNLIRYFSIPRHYLRSLSNYLFLNRIVPVLTNQLKTYQADVIHAHTEYAGLAAIKVGKKLGLPVVVTLHGVNTAQRLQNSSYRKILSYVLSNADKVVMVGTPLIQYYSGFVENTLNFTVIHNGFRLSPYTANETLNKHTPRVKFISVSNLHEGKGIDLNLIALSSLVKKGMDDWSYTVVGDGRERNFLKGLCQDLNIAQRVKFVGACPHQQVYQYLSDADVFILPSYREAFGIAYLEAMASGLLTVGIESQGAAEFIEHNKTGFLVPSQNVDALTRCFESIYKSDDLFLDISEKGCNEVLQKFTWENHAKKLIDLFQDIIESPIR